MNDGPPGPGLRTSLRGRGNECTLLDDLLSAIRQGESRSLVLRGEPGIGKTALAEYLAESASDLTVVRAARVESEMELPYVSLHQLCGPLLDRVGALPEHDLERLTLGARQPLELADVLPDPDLAPA